VIATQESPLLKTLREKAREISQPRGPKCSVCKLPPETIASINALRTDGFPCTTIAETLETIKVSISAAVITAHFRRCTKKANEQPNR
jgi:hypothetical protein